MILTGFLGIRKNSKKDKFGSEALSQGRDSDLIGEGVILHFPARVCVQSGGQLCGAISRCPAHSVSRVDCSSRTSQPGLELGMTPWVFPMQQPCSKLLLTSCPLAQLELDQPGSLACSPEACWSLPEWVSRTPGLTS